MKPTSFPVPWEHGCLLYFGPEGTRVAFGVFPLGFTQNISQKRRTISDRMNPKLKCVKTQEVNNIQRYIRDASSFKNLKVRKPPFLSNLIYQMVCLNQGSK